MGTITVVDENKEGALKKVQAPLAGKRIFQMLESLAWRIFLPSLTRYRSLIPRHDVSLYDPYGPYDRPFDTPLNHVSLIW